MSVNKYKPHLYVIPEDDADRQIAVGFVLHARVASRQVSVVEPAGGWSGVLKTFKDEYLSLLQQNGNTHVVLLIDFDGNPEARRAKFDREIPVDVRDRVFVLGPRETPEALKQSLGPDLEDIGHSLADDCAGNNLNRWGHPDLRHNHDDLNRLVNVTKPLLWN